MALTPKQLRFVEEYLIDLDGVAAYYRAGYKPKNRNCAAVESYKLRHHPAVAAAIEAKQAELRQSTQVTVERVVQAYATIAFFDIRRLFGTDGKLKPMHELDADTAAAIAGFDLSKQSFRLADRKGALDSLARTLGMFKDRVEHTGAGGGPIKTEDVSMVDAARRIAFMMSAAVQELETKH